MNYFILCGLLLMASVTVYTLKTRAMVPKAIRIQKKR